MSLFVLEIGTEEIPARFLAGEERELHDRFVAALAEAGIGYGTVRTMSTPRRAVLMLEDVEDVQREREEIVTGPPARVAYDAHGAPANALIGFARTHQVAVESVFTVSTPKGEYIAVRKRSGGARTAALLAKICPAIIAALPFGKRMRWADHSFLYGRPLHWVLALFDEDLVPFQVGPVTSGRQTWGHRIHGPGPFTLASAREYLPVLTEQGGVMPDPAARRAAIVEYGNRMAGERGGRVLWKESLLDEVQGLCEHPEPLLGAFDEAFLEVPREVLLTSMESHQKSFGVEGADGKLLPCFLTVANVSSPEPDLVRKGWERVLRARLEDARFFWRTDLADSFAHWLDRLENVIFLGPLGSMGEKTRRLEQLCRWIASTCTREAPALAARAGRLSKADLVSGMVGEFDTLQGIMGGIYAARMGEDAAVAAALKEQYLPAGPDSPLPVTPLGAILAIADKADTLVGCFGLGMIPTGAADPNGLRRCALGIARILLNAPWLRLSVKALLCKAQELYGERQWKLAPEESLRLLQEFFAARLKQYFMAQEGKDTLLVEAVLGAGCDDVWAAARRLAALEALSKQENYASQVQTFKRVSNIVRKQGQGLDLDGPWDNSLLQEDAEKALADLLDELLPRIDALWEQDDFNALFALLETLRPAVDAFFDGVMVICEDAALRVNRLKLLSAIRDRMGRLADFGALQI